MKGIGIFLLNIRFWENTKEGLREFSELRESMIPKIISKATFYRCWEQAKEERLIKAKLVCFDMFLYLTSKGRKMLKRLQND